jgi:general L-amino acid transport system substrate-binding protein
VIVAWRPYDVLVDGVKRSLRRLIFAIVPTLFVVTTPTQTASRLERIEHRGLLGCGIEAAVPGFAEIDAAGHYRGMDIDICRAIAAAIFGTSDKIKYVPAGAVTEFLRNDGVDVVARRLTWKLQREQPRGVLFGPVTFYDGQTFLVSRTLDVTTIRQLSGKEICVAGGEVFESQLNDYFASHGLELKKVVLESSHQYAAIAQALSSGRCRVYTGDLSDLGAIRSKLAAAAGFQILPEQISKEPLAPLVRNDDAQWFGIVRWTMFALIAAEELGVTSRNVDQMRASQNLDVQRLLGVAPGNGKALGLNESWAYHAIKTVGNYGEVFERNLGSSSPMKFDRGLNRLAKDGGLMYAPPLK